MKRYTFFSLMLIVSMLSQFVVTVASADGAVAVYYVKTNGNDARDGRTPRGAFKTLSRVKRAVLSSISDHDVVVNIDEGIYFTESSFGFTADELGSAKHSLTIKAREQGQNVIISGGRKVEGFRLYEKNIYRAVYTSDVRQLYVNGAPALRARSASDMGIEIVTNTENGRVSATGFRTADTSIAGWQNITNVELVFKQSFVSSRICISSVDVTNGFANINVKNIDELSSSYSLLGEHSALLYVENAYELLDEGGEWYSDGSYIYYMPREGETINEVIASNVEKPVDFAGTPDNAIENITVEGIIFSHGGWLYPSKSKKLIACQSNVIASGDNEVVPGAVNVIYGNNIEFDGCKFTDSGANGLNILDGSKNVRVTGCEFSNLAAGGIQIGRVVGSGEVTLPTDDKEIIENITVEQSKIHSLATEYYSASGLAMGFAKNCHFVHNEIYDLPYAGIHIGWGWSYRTNSITQGTRVKYNFIHDCMKLLYDGGLIYTLGGTNTDRGIQGDYNEIAYNYLQNLRGGGGYIYNDNGSSYWSVHHNVIMCTDATDYSWVNIAPDTNNILNQLNYINTQNDENNRTEDALLRDMMRNNIAYEFRDGIAVSNGYSLWTANKIMENAGVSEEKLYSLYDIIHSSNKSNVVCINDDAIIKDGGYIEFDTLFLDKTLDFDIYPEYEKAETGEYRIIIDDTYTITVTANSTKLSDPYHDDIEVISSIWDRNAVGDISLSLSSGSLTFSTGNMRRLGLDREIAQGRVKIEVSGMNMAIGSLTKHVSFYQKRLASLDSVSSVSKSMAVNGYFEAGVEGWSTVGANVVHSTEYAYGNSMGSMKITETAYNGYAYTTAELKAGKWYCISAMLKSDRFPYEQVEFESDADSDWGMQYTLNAGWNYLRDYIRVDTDGAYKFYLSMGERDSTYKKHTYYIDNFEIVEEEPKLTEIGFENGIGAWNGTHDLKPAISENGYTGKALYFDTTSSDVTYKLPYRAIYLKPGETYRVRAMIYTQAVTSDDVCVYLSIDDDRYNVNINDQTAYVGGRAAVGRWIALDFTFTWKSNELEEFSLAYIKVLIRGGKGKVYVDDVELYKISMYKERSENADFVCGMNSWEYDDSSNIYQEVGVRNNTEYYAECFVRPDSDSQDEHKFGNIKIVLPDNGNLENTDVTSKDFIAENGTIKSRARLLDKGKWTRLGGKIKLSAENLQNIRARLSAEVLNESGDVVNCEIKGFKLCPAGDYDTDIMTVSIFDGKVIYSVSGNSNAKLRYRYYKYNNGWQKTNEGYANIGDTLPLIGGGRCYAELTVLENNGADGMTVLAESTNIISLDTGKIAGRINISAAASNPDGQSFIVAVYSGGQLKNTFISESEYLKACLDAEEMENVRIKAFIWDISECRGICDFADNMVVLN